MKKLLAFLLSLCLLGSALAACDKETDTSEATTQPPTESTPTTETPLVESPATDFTETEQGLSMSTWDGDIATSFGGGDGTKQNPYQIKNASQLAFLAQEINSGKNDKENYFSLMCDIDLNSLEWTPIGNGTSAFKGNFDGNGHTIKHLKITEGVSYTQDEFSRYAAGLFGVCSNCTVQDLILDGMEIIVQKPKKNSYLSAGFLMGALTVHDTAEIFDIKISDSKMISAFEKSDRAKMLSLGGLVGDVRSDDVDSHVRMYNNQSDIKASVESGWYAIETLLIGGLVGNCVVMNEGDIQNCASYLSVSIDPENCYGAQNILGAFGRLQIYTATFSMTNVFSKVSVNKIYDTNHGYSAYIANAIAGEVYHGKQSDGTVVGGCKFENIFGCVVQNELTMGKTQVSKKLYDMPKHAIYSETNCEGCVTLPQGHGFDVNVWDLQDLSAPKLK